jgi:hypothetical protein
MKNRIYIWASLFSLLSLVATASGDVHVSAGPEPTSAVLFLFAALAFGIIFRRTLPGSILPYTAALLVRNVYTCTSALRRAKYLSLLAK